MAKVVKSKDLTDEILLDDYRAFLQVARAKFIQLGVAENSVLISYLAACLIKRKAEICAGIEGPEHRDVLMYLENYANEAEALRDFIENVYRKGK